MDQTNRPNIYKKIFTYISNIILVILLIVGIFLLISLVPGKNNIKIYAVLSGSMEPTIPTGALVTIKPASAYSTGDIITFHSQNLQSSKDLVTHRIYAIKKINGTDAFITKGDANKAPDSESISKTNIVGKYVFSVALIGYLLGYVKTLPGLVIIIIIPATIIIYEEMNKIKREAAQMIVKRKEKSAACANTEIGSKTKKKGKE